MIASPVVVSVPPESSAPPALPTETWPVPVRSSRMIAFVLPLVTFTLWKATPVAADGHILDPQADAVDGVNRVGGSQHGKRAAAGGHEAVAVVVSIFKSLSVMFAPVLLVIVTALLPPVLRSLLPWKLIVPPVLFVTSMPSLSSLIELFGVSVTVPPEMF